MPAFHLCINTILITDILRFLILFFFLILLVSTKKEDSSVFLLSISSVVSSDAGTFSCNGDSAFEFEVSVLRLGIHDWAGFGWGLIGYG